MLVKATREGLVGGKTASGWVIDTETLFVALPCIHALHKQVKVTNPANGASCVATVLDVGPWNTDDFKYVFEGARPLAERGISVSMKGTNNAGIDLSEAVWAALGMEDNTDVEWEFCLNVLP